MWYFYAVNLVHFFELNTHEHYIERCITLAQNGLGSTYPNPLVGSVIVHNDVIIGEGWHQQAGGPHAEVHAIQSVKDKSLLKNATIYVSLEPCSHFGKTPPCANLIIEHNIPNVVIGCVDTFSEVSGNGIKKLKEHGCNVTVGILEDACKALNKRFFTYHNKKRPYIILKWAETKDGFIAPENNSEITWISNEYSKQLSHKLRTTEQSILIGTTTGIIDNPSLTARNWYGKNPTRLVIDTSGKIPKTYNIFNKAAKTIVFTAQEVEQTEAHISYVRITSDKLPTAICDALYEKEIQSVIIEGGSNTLSSFIAQDLWDEAYVFKGNTIFNKGVEAPHISGRTIKEQSLASDTLTIYQND